MAAYAGFWLTFFIKCDKIDIIFSRGKFMPPISIKKGEEKYLAEIERLERIMFYERRLQAEGLRIIAGVDEVGRGPLAGPVVACALVLPEEYILYLDDSKKMPEKRREEIFETLLEKAADAAVGVVSNEVIDEINILQATYMAMRQAVGGLKSVPEALLVDYVTIPGINIMQTGITKGDSKSASIAAASIYAKVTRDRMLKEFDEIYPEYDFASNKGYGTKRHYEALEKYGPCPIHRRSFLQGMLDL